MSRSRFAPMCKRLIQRSRKEHFTATSISSSLFDMVRGDVGEEKRGVTEVRVCHVGQNVTRLKTGL